jgi:hypothetical protein
MRLQPPERAAAKHRANASRRSPRAGEAFVARGTAPVPR